MADVDQGHDDENCEGDFLISCISKRVVPVREIFIFRIVLNK